MNTVPGSAPVELLSPSWARGTVWWIDAHHAGEQYATVEDIAREHRPMLRGDTGWVVQSDEVGITLALSWMPKTEHDSFLHRPSSASDFIDLMFIPRAMIQGFDSLEASERFTRGVERLEKSDANH